MKTPRRNRYSILAFVLTALLAPGFDGNSQNVNIPDPELLKAVRHALSKPAGDITVQDMEELTTLNANGPDASPFRTDPIRNLEGLETAKNLTSLSLRGTANSQCPRGPSSGGCIFPRITDGDLSALGGLHHLSLLNLELNDLRQLSLPSGLTNLTGLWLGGNSLATLPLPNGGRSLLTLDLGRDDGDWDFSIGGNRLTDFSFLTALTNLTVLRLSGSGLSTFTLAGSLSKLTTLDLTHNELTNLALPDGLTNLGSLYLFSNQLRNLALPTGLRSITNLVLADNQLTSLTLPTDVSNLTTLNLNYNRLTNLTLPTALASLTDLWLDDNQLTDVSFVAGLTGLTVLGLENNQLSEVLFPSGFTKLTWLFLGGNQLTNLALPADLRSLEVLGLWGNPLAKVALPAGNESLTWTLLNLRTNGVQVTILPVLKYPRRLDNGEFTFSVFADAGTYVVSRSTDLQNWSDIGFLNVAFFNSPGATFTDPSDLNQSAVFYRLK